MGGCDSVHETLGGVLGTNPKPKTKVSPNWYDPLGPTGMDKNGKPIFAPTGGAQQRTQTFAEFDRLRPMFEQNADATSSRLRAAADDPGYAAARGLATSQINGDYLHGSPELDAAMAQMRAAGAGQAADAAARVRGTYARNGMGFSTANQQAEQAATAAGTAQANQTEAAARLANYGAERGIQQSSTALLDQATQSPLNYLSSIPQQYLGPLAQMATMISGLAGGQQTAQPDTIVNPSYLGQLTGDVGKL